MTARDYAARLCRTADPKTSTPLDGTDRLLSLAVAVAAERTVVAMTKQALPQP
jgi:hypothetical protein